MSPLADLFLRSVFIRLINWIAICMNYMNGLSAKSDSIKQSEQHCVSTCEINFAISRAPKKQLAASNCFFTVNDPLQASDF